MRYICLLNSFHCFLCVTFTQDSSCSGFKSYETKEDIENVLMNTFDGAEAAVLDLKQYNPEEDLILTELIDELAKDNSETTPTNVNISFNSVAY